MSQPADAVARQWSADVLELGEGGRWIDGQLHLVDVLSGRLLVASDPRPGGLRELLRMPGTLGAVARCAGSDRWIAATGTGVAVVGPAGHIDWLARPEDRSAVPMRMNDAAVDTSGRFWAGSMAADATAGAGSLYRVDRDGTVSKVLDGLSIPNGPAFTPDGSYMYLADTKLGIVDRFTLGPAGTLEAREPFLRFDVREGLPDGMTTDAEGNLWVALWGGAAVRRYRPDGTLDRIVRVPASQPTSVCLGGASARDLYITSAFVGLTDPTAADGAIFLADAGIPGTPARICEVR